MTRENGAGPAVCTDCTKTLDAPRRQCNGRGNDASMHAREESEYHVESRWIREKNPISCREVAFASNGASESGCLVSRLGTAQGLRLVAAFIDIDEERFIGSCLGKRIKGIEEQSGLTRHQLRSTWTKRRRAALYDAQ